MWVHIHWTLYRLKLAVQTVKKMNPTQAAPIFTKWRWDASRIKEEELRNTFLDGITRMEQFVQTHNQDRPNVKSGPSGMMLLLLCMTCYVAVLLFFRLCHWLLAVLIH
jgi:hypothetical protein